MGRARGNRFGFAFFDFLISLGVGHAYAFANIVALHYLLFDRKAAARTAAYLKRRFPNEGGLKRAWRIQRIFANAGRVLVDLRCAERDPSSVKMECDADHIRRLLSQGKGVLMLTAHVGNWQAMMRAFPNLGADVAVVMRPEDNPAVEEWLGVERGAGKVKMINPDQGAEAALEIMRWLTKGGVVAIMADKPLEGGRTLERDCFGAPCPFPEGPFLIAAAAEAPVVFTVPKRGGGQKYILQISELDIDETLSGTKVRRDAFLDVYAKALERFLEENPHDWTPAGEL